MSPDRQRNVQIPPHRLEALLGVPAAAQGLVIFAHGSGSGRLSPRNQHVAAALRSAGFATLLLDLLMPQRGGLEVAQALATLLTEPPPGISPG